MNGKSGLCGMMSSKKAFPKKELNQWLKGRKHWNHADWLKLLDTLRVQGYGAYTDNQEARNGIGAYLEANREKK